MIVLAHDWIGPNGPWPNGQCLDLLVSPETYERSYYSVSNKHVYNLEDYRHPFTYSKLNGVIGKNFTRKHITECKGKFIYELTPLLKPYQWVDNAFDYVSTVALEKQRQGHYPVDFKDCFVLVFWTGISRREFFRSNGSKFWNYGPTWANNFQIYKKFHKIYSQSFWHEGYDLNKTFNYVFSIGPLLKHYEVEYKQGNSLENEELCNLIKKYEIDNFLSYNPNDSIASTVIIEGGGIGKSNPYILSGHHPSELGHQYLAEKYAKMIDK